MLLFFLMCSFSFTHRQHTHQYLTIQGYKLLVRTLLRRYPVLSDKPGGFEPNIGNYPWLERKILLTVTPEEYKFNDFYEQKRGFRPFLPSLYIDNYYNLFGPASITSCEHPSSNDLKLSIKRAARESYFCQYSSLFAHAISGKRTSSGTSGHVEGTS